MNTLYTLFATCPRGLETVLSQELESLGCTEVRAFDGGVSCRGGLEQAYAANLHSRTAGRILLRLTKGTYRTERDIYKLAKNINWFNWFTLQQTFKVKIEAKRANVKSLQFAGLTVKDAVCDAFRDIYDARPSVDKAAPDVRIHAFLDERNVEIFIDTSGEALFKRGYRLDTGEAPLRENLAAGLLLSAGYDGTQPFQDPFCGSGTIAIEAAWIAAGRAPGRCAASVLKNCKISIKRCGRICAAAPKRKPAPSAPRLQAATTAAASFRRHWTTHTMPERTTSFPSALPARSPSVRTAKTASWCPIRPTACALRKSALCRHFIRSWGRG
ncbi:putative methylase [Neisseria gonorrhoeae]|nr:rRNA large subunit methyltransferase L [Neisseria gonorrhoeae]QBK54721.1 Ribosomal RNA large subunit methyltransferase L [Neisseria gonorrhoeae]CFC28114.1 putative methylase [Neisseria gonorrhoeae]CFH17608.1 putative methylase [Neisseria gonorrhoeae]CFR92513.1 putative methylase [Neisseria gonorrhoeae]